MLLVVWRCLGQMISKGWADVLSSCMFCFSISRVAVGVMYPAVAIAG